MKPANTSILQRFRSDERGAVMIMFGLSAVVLFMFAGLGIDLSRVHHERSRVSSALDAAALAAGRALLDGRMTDEQVREIAQSYFEQNVSVAERFGSVTNLVVEVNRATSSVTVTAMVEVPLTLARVGGFDKYTFPLTAATSFEQQDIELSLALDVTGSMGGSGKIDALKTASNDLFDILLPDAGTPNQVRIALAPYSSGVNAGTYAATATGTEAPGGCTFERTIPVLASDAAPGTGTYFKGIGSPGITAGAYCPPTSLIVPLTDNKSTLRDEVAAYSASGSTAGHLGVQWAWNLISPGWGGIFTGDNAPGAYGDSKIRKIMVLMTDGLFNTMAGVNNGDTSPTAAQSQLLAVKLCQNMRDKGVTVYSVGFKLDEISSAKLRDKASQTLKDCAGDTKRYFDAASASDLRTAFQTIAEQINNLRLTN